MMYCYHGSIVQMDVDKKNCCKMNRIMPGCRDSSRRGPPQANR